jgi:type I restriction enzyme S subunit
MLDAVKNKGKEFKYLRNINVRWFSFDLTDLKSIKLEDHEIEKYYAYKGDLLVCEGGYPGRGAIWDNEEPIIFQKAIHRIRFIYHEHTKWFLYYLWLLDMTRTIENYFTGAGIQHLTGDNIKKIIFPLPPLAEQREIVRHVEKLLAFVGELDGQVQERKEQVEGLAQAVLRETMEG